MGKAKKKSTPLNTYQKALASALNIQNSSPNETRDCIKSLREAYKGISTRLGIQDTLLLEQQPVRTADNAKFYDAIYSHEANLTQNTAYLEMIRILGLGMWLQDKTVYSLDPGMMDYIRNQTGIGKYNAKHNLNLTKLYAELCRRPIYIEFAEGPILGAFCIATTLHPLDKNCMAFFAIIQARNGDGNIYCHCSERLTIQEVLGGTMADSIYEIGGGSNGNIIIDEDIYPLLHLALAYVGYCYIANDTYAAITPTAKQSACVYNVHPVEGMVDPTLLFASDGWLGRGLCEFVGYLKRDNMLKDFKSCIDEYHAQHGNPKMDIREWETGRDTEAKFNTMVCEWEQNRFVYQYTRRSDEAFRDKYLTELALSGFPEELFAYFPYRTIALHEKTNDYVTLVSPCYYVKEDGSSERGIAFASMNGYGNFTVVPISASVFADAIEENLDHLIQASCALYHILVSLRAITQKRLTEDFAAQGDPASRALAATTERKPHQARENGEPESNVRYTRPLDMPELNIFDVSLKTFKRASKSTTERYMKWHMAPHTRRRHPHRYWVGKGADRHLEIRWLEPMQINASDKDEHTTICKLPET